MAIGKVGLRTTSLPATLVSSVSFVLFLAVESIVSERILDLGLFRKPQFTVAMVVTSARSVALYGGIFLLPLFLQDLMGRSEIDTGLLLLPGALVMGLVMLVSGRIADWLGTRVCTILGLLFIAWFMWTYRRLDVTTSTWAVLYPTLVRGVGLGLLVTPVMTAAINAVPTPKAGMASSMLSLIQQISGSLGIAVLACVSAGARPSTSRWWVRAWMPRDPRSLAQPAPSPLVRLSLERHPPRPASSRARSSRARSPERRRCSHSTMLF